MKTTTRPSESTPAAAVLFMSFELGEARWKLGFSTAPAQRPRLRTIPARDPGRVLVEISLAKARFGLSATTRVVSCYEAGRDGFWLHRFLTREGVENYVVDASSIEVNRRLRRRRPPNTIGSGLDNDGPHRRTRHAGDEMTSSLGAKRRKTEAAPAPFVVRYHPIGDTGRDGRLRFRL